MIYDFIIIGAGISGALTAAYLREEYQLNVLILEKDDVFGGRCQTRTISGLSFNIGNLFFRDSHEPLVNVINHFLPNALRPIYIDYVNLIDEQYHIDTRYIFLPESKRMSQTCEDLCKGTEVQLNQEVCAIIDKTDHFQINTGSQPFYSKHVVLTAPADHANQLLNTLGLSVDVPIMNSIFTFVGVYNPKNEFDFPYYKFINHPILKEVFIDKETHTLTIHANDYIHQPLSEINENLVIKTVYEAFRNYFKLKDIDLFKSHQWNFAKDRERVEIQNIFELNGKFIHLTGDWISKQTNLNGVLDSFNRFRENIKKTM